MLFLDISELQKTPYAYVKAPFFFQRKIQSA